MRIYFVDDRRLKFIFKQIVNLYLSDMFLWVYVDTRVLNDKLFLNKKMYNDANLFIKYFVFIL